MSRYIERAENVARFVDVNLHLMLDAPAGQEQQWLPLINTSGDHKLFAERYGQATQEHVIQFLTFDPEYANSILSCVRGARENARSIREIISSEMWEHINRFYLVVKDAATDLQTTAGQHKFFTEVKEASHLFCGIAEATMSRNEAWHFLRLGRMLERADKTSRILDVKYFMLLRSAADVGTPFDDVQWAAVLRSASAFEMYRKCHGRMSSEGIVQFLLLDPEFPRAIRYCLNSTRESLHAISGTPIESFKNPAERALGQLCSDLAYANTEEIIRGGLHEYLDDLQTKVNLVGQGISDTFFARRMPEPGKKSMLQRNQ
jgi:uncharacterized alpha-E superfamily protein